MRSSSSLAEAGWVEVFRARDTKLKRDVAIKVLPEAFARDQQRMKRFAREAEVFASVNHPNIASIYGLGESDGITALVLELIEGPTLAERIAKGPISPDEALPIAGQMAEGLEAAYERGIIHRDFKPANVKVREDGTVKLLDFGLAKALLMDDEDGESEPSESPTMSAAATRAGVIMGTAAYMSPALPPGVSRYPRRRVSPDSRCRHHRRRHPSSPGSAETSRSRRMASGSSTGGVDRAWHVRHIDRFETTRLDLVDPSTPFISPDGTWIGFQAAGVLQKVPFLGGPPTTICKVESGFSGASWGGDGTIVFATSRTGLFQVPAGGGEPRQLTKLNGVGEGGHLWPEMLPGDGAVLFVIDRGGAGASGYDIAVLSLETGEQRVLIRGGTSPRYVPTGISCMSFSVLH